MEHLEKGKCYSVNSEVYCVEETFPNDRYRVRVFAYHEDQKLWIYKDRIESLADGLDGVTKATENASAFLVWVFTTDKLTVFYRDE